MQPQLTILTSGSDPANTLQIITATPTIQTTSNGSIVDIQKRITERTAQIQQLIDQNTADQALIGSVTGVFTAAGVTDVTAPTTDTINAAITAQNATANAAVVAAQITALQAPSLTAEPPQTETI